MKNSDHLDNGLLIQFLDGELAGAGEFAAVRTHLSICALCRHKRDEFARLSSEIEKVAGTVQVTALPEARAKLSSALLRKEGAGSNRQNAAKTMRRFGWGMAIAASLALGILLAPLLHQGVQPRRLATAQSKIASLEVDGENFIAVPYSNPDLPLNAPRVIEMQVPVSSLAAAGIFLQLAANGSEDRTVAADVLLGMDGQPLGVHLLSTE